MSFSALGSSTLTSIISPFLISLIFFAIFKTGNGHLKTHKINQFYLFYHSVLKKKHYIIIQKHLITLL